MYYVISCVDKAGHAHVRAENRPAHVDYLKANIDHIVMAGPTLSEDGEGMTGSVLIMEYESLADAQAVADGDPFTWSRPPASPMRDGRAGAPWPRRRGKARWQAAGRHSASPAPRPHKASGGW